MRSVLRRLRRAADAGAWGRGVRGRDISRVLLGESEHAAAALRKESRKQPDPERHEHQKEREKPQQNENGCKPAGRREMSTR